MPRCLTDIAGPFYDKGKPFRNWSALPFTQLDLLAPPYVDQAQLARGVRRAMAYLALVRAQGYSGIVIDNLAHLVGFERTPDAIYAEDSPERLRARTYRAAFGALFDEAARLGMEVFVTCDMQWSTPALRRYAGRIDPDNPRLAAANRWALEELFGLLPQVSGVVLRAGETGGAHDQAGAYSGHMIYTSVRALRGLIGELLPVCEQHGRLLIVRTWSVGIGETGDLLCAPKTYRAVFEGFSSPALLTSIKHVPSDFFRLQPHNPTIGLPGPQQIVELQNRREYELFGMVPSTVAALHQQALRHAAATGQLAGIWAWNSTGGWGGGSAALGRGGWSLWTELSSALTAALLRDPALDAEGFVRAWCQAKLGAELGNAAAALYRDSDKIIEQGWYQGPLSGGERRLGSLYLPSLLWVWWMRPTASLLTWAYLALAVEDLPATLAEGKAAVEQAASHAAQLAALAPADGSLAVAIATSADYLHASIALAQTIKGLMLPLLDAAWERDHRRWLELARSAGELRGELRRISAAWQGRGDFPPLEVEEIDAFLEALGRRPGQIWLLSRAICALVQRHSVGRLPGRRSRRVGLRAAALLLMLGVRRRRRASFAALLFAGLLASPLRQRLLRLLLPRLNRRLFLLPSIFFEAGPAFTEWTR